MRVHALQLDIVWRDKAANQKKVQAFVEQAQPQEGDLIVLPEMFATGFDVEYGDLVEGLSDTLGPTGKFLSDLARSFGVYVQGTGITPGHSGKRRNLAAAYAPSGEQISSFAKLHPFTFGGEHKRFEAGEGLSAWPLGDFLASPLICYDLRFPEAFRQATRAGANLFLVLANWPAPRHSHWLPLLQARAIENQAYVVGVNRCGRDKFLQYNGQSAVFSPKGETLALAGAEEAVLTVELDIEELRKWRAGFPVLQDIREDLLPLV